MQTEKKIAVVGAGLVGGLLAIHLRKLGYSVTLYDRSQDIRTVDFTGRSINLAVSTRGWNALETVGISEEINEIAIPMDKRAIHSKEGQITYQPYGINGEAIYSVSRGELNRKIIDIADQRGTEFKFSHKIWDVSLEDATLYIGDDEKGPLEAHKYDVIFGADGAFSKIRQRMQRQNRFNYSQYFLELGYKELCIPAKEDGSHHLDPNSFHIWPRKDFMLIALPNIDGSFTCTLFLPFEGALSFESIVSEEQIVEFFNEYFQDALPYMPTLVDDYTKNPTSSLVTTQCYPWIYDDKIALLGDAAHAIVPFYGQGMNAGFEDVTEMYHQILKGNDDWKQILNNYQINRKPNGDAIAELSFRNFKEMGTDTADEMFLLQKKIEAKFTKKYPEKWLPLYDRVSFSLQPYHEVLEIGNKQRAIMEEIMQYPNIKHIWETDEIYDIINEKIKSLS